MADTWIDPALEIVRYDDYGIFDCDEFFNILQSSVDSKADRSLTTCYFCKRRVHGWCKCFRLRNILQANGMKGNGPFPPNTRATPTAGKSQPKPAVNGDESNLKPVGR